MGDILTTILNNIDYSVPVFCLKAFLFITGFFFVSTILTNIFDVLYYFLFANKFGYRIKFISLLGLVFVKKGNKWVKILYNPSLLCICLPVIDCENIQQDYLKKEKQLNYSQRFVTLFISIIIFALTFKPIIAIFKGESISLTDIFLIGFSTGMIFHSLNHILISIYVYGRINKGLTGYTQSKSELMLKGDSIENLDLKPIEELPYKSPSEIEKLFYYLIYVSYLLSLNKQEELEKVSHEMTDMLWKKNMNLFYYYSYYWLIFYYSEIEKDKEKADDFFKKIDAFISNDEESNAKRVLAYYYYRLYNDGNKARTLIEEGLSTIDKYSCGSERALEKKLLLNLKNEIESKPIDF